MLWSLFNAIISSQTLGRLIARGFFYLVDIKKVIVKYVLTMCIHCDILHIIIKVGKQKMANINIRTEENVKREATQIFNALGLDMSSAVNIFLRKTIMQQGIPFELKLEVPNETTIKAIKEADEMVKNGCVGYDNLDDLWSALNV